MEIVGKTIAETWEESVRQLLSHGEWVPTQRGMLALELRGILLHVLNPEDQPIVSEKYQFGDDFLSEYRRSMMSDFPEKSIKARIYEYGANRINQLETITNTLEYEWYSRRAVASLWNPELDLQHEHPPCLTNLHFMVRKGGLCLTATLRSNDAWMAALPDMIALTSIQSQIASGLNREIGDYIQLASSYHIYESDIAMARAVFDA